MNSDTQVEILPNEAEIIAKINELHLKAESLARQAKDNASESISYAVECGKLLIEQKKFVKHGDWLEWITKNCNFKKSAAENYMSLFKKITLGENSNSHHSGNLETLAPKTLRQAYIATGILSKPPKVIKTDSDDSTVSYIKHIDKITEWYKNLIEQKPLRDWSLVERKAVLNDLKPIVQIFNELSSKENI